MNAFDGLPVWRSAFRLCAIFCVLREIAMMTSAMTESITPAQKECGNESSELETVSSSPDDDSL